MTAGGEHTRIKLQKGRRLVKRGGIWTLDTCIRGIQERRSLGTGDFQEAPPHAALGGEPAAVLVPPFSS
jgi:hypothetical protein